MKLEVAILEFVKRIKRNYFFYGWRGVLFVAKSRLLTLPTEAKVTPPAICRPVFLRTKTSDIPTYHQVFIDLEYEVELSKEPRVIIDCGANIGFASIYFTNRYPEAKVLAIEPEVSNFKLLQKNVRCYPNIVPIRAALWKDNVDIQVIDPGHGYWGFQTQTYKEGYSDQVVAQVSGIRIEKIMKDYDLEFIDILKIDIEGAEKEVFEDVSKWIDKVGVMIIELHECVKPGCSQNVYQSITGFNFEFRNGENMFFARKEFVHKKGLRMEWQIRSTSSPMTQSCSKEIENRLP